MTLLSGARLYAAMATLAPATLAAPSAVNFGSILAIANHLVLADRLWLNRFTGQGAPVPTVDAVIHLPGRGVVLIERLNEPYGWALPGGFVDYGESAEAAARSRAACSRSAPVQRDSRGTGPAYAGGRPGSPAISCRFTGISTNTGPGSPLVATRTAS